MNVLNNIQNINGKISFPKNKIQKQESQTKKEYKPDVLDFLSEKVVNKNDLNDMVTTPRAIFKGYLCFTAGTAVNTIGSLIKQGKFANALKITGCLATIYGTYNFVKPYLIRKNDLTKSEK